jgi:hypothetical protein
MIQFVVFKLSLPWRLLIVYCYNSSLVISLLRIKVFYNQKLRAQGARQPLVVYITHQIRFFRKVHLKSSTKASSTVHLNGTRPDYYGNIWTSSPDPTCSFLNVMIPTDFFHPLISFLLLHVCTAQPTRGIYVCKWQCGMLSPRILPAITKY